MDRNKDGKVTKDDVPERMWDRLSTADTDKNGELTKEEFEAFFKQRGERRRPDADPPADKPADPPASKTENKPADKPADKTAEQPVETSTETPAA